MSTTKLDYAILGLLRTDPLSGYQIRQIFETSDMGQYSSSPGSIYPAVKRLQRKQFIRQIEWENEVGKTKKRFQLTEAGRIHLIQWLKEEISQEDVDKFMDILLLKFAFMDELLSREEQLQFLYQIELLLPKKIAELQAFESLTDNQLSLTAQLAILHGKQTFETHLNWVRQAVERLQIIINKNHKQ